MEAKEFIVFFIISSLIGITLFNMFYMPTTKIYIINQTKYVKNSGVSYAEIYIPAVDEKGQGVVTKLRVKAIPGNGKVLVNINQLLFWVDTQYSIQTAKRVAEKVTGLNLTNYDLVYSIETNASVIEGPSAGAAITIATIAALENKSLNRSVMITGTINPDGRIGPVGGILAKAQAAKSVNATVFLVPKGQGTQVTYIPIKKCRNFGYMTFCEINYEMKEVSITKEVGIEVKEVSSIEDALNYFLS